MNKGTKHNGTQGEARSASLKFHGGLEPLKIVTLNMYSWALGLKAKAEGSTRLDRIHGVVRWSGTPKDSSGPHVITMSWVWVQPCLSWFELSTFVTLVLNSTHDKQRCAHQTEVLSFFWILWSPSVFFFYCSRNLCGVMGRMLERGPNNRQSLPWSFLFFRSPQRCAQRCLCADRSRFLDPTGNDACQMKKRMYSTSAPCVTVREYHDLHKWDTGVFVSWILLWLGRKTTPPGPPGGQTATQWRFQLSLIVSWPQTHIQIVVFVLPLASKPWCH